MKNRDFYYWLQGLFELSEDFVLTDKQIAIIQNHINLVEGTNGEKLGIGIRIIRDFLRIKPNGFTGFIKEVLEQQFEHIDKEFNQTNNSEILSHLHSGGEVTMPDGSTAQLKC